MFNNVPREELIEFFRVFAQWCFEMAKWFLLTGIVLVILGIFVLYVIELLRTSSEVKKVDKVRRNR